MAARGPLDKNDHENLAVLGLWHLCLSPQLFLLLACTLSKHLSVTRYKATHASTGVTQTSAVVLVRLHLWKTNAAQLHLTTDLMSQEGLFSRALPDFKPKFPLPATAWGKPTFHLGDEPQAALEVGADGVEAPAELGIAAVLVGPAGVVTNVQLVAALGHGGDAQI